MKKTLFLLFIFSIGQAWCQSKLNPQKIQGQWAVTWSYFSSTKTKKSEGSAPIVESIWTFNSNGTYAIHSSIEETGKYYIKDSVLFMDTDQNYSPEFDKREYSIVTLNDTTLEVGSEITRTDSFFMVSYAVLTRKE